MKNRVVAGVIVVMVAGLGALFWADRPSPQISGGGPESVGGAITSGASLLNALTNSNANWVATAPQTGFAASNVTGKNPYAPSLREPGKFKRAWDVNFMAQHQTSAAGDPIQFDLPDGRTAEGVVRITQYRAGVLSYISGDLSAPETGEFFFLTPPQLGVAGKAVGVVQLTESKIAYRIEPTGIGGEPELWQRRLDEVICMPPPQPVAGAEHKPLDGEVEDPQEIPPLRPDEVASYIPSYNSNIVSLQSYPGAAGVLLLDFFGGYTPTWRGVYYSRPAAANNNNIRDIWKRVAEDYLPFNINVTTDIKVYLAAPETSRQRVAFTDTPVTPAGVAYYGSWNWGGDTPCWSVYSTGKSAGEVASHEAGHTLGLSHQGQWNGTTVTNEYYGGHGSGETGWAPIMGVGYYQPVAQWAKGEFHAANELEDELSIIVNNNNAVDYRPDDTGATLATSRHLEIHPDESVFAEGVIERTSDTDAFQFTTTGGLVSLTARPVNNWANLGLAVTIANGANVVIHTNNPQNTLWASIKANLPPGTYTFRVTGVGKNNPLTDGFTAYASLGYYSIVGNVPGARQPNRFSLFERVPNGTTVGTVPPNAAGNLVYTIASGNTGNTFAIDNAGTLTVANNTLLVYDQLATNSMLRVGFELFVNIANLDDPGLTEMNRRVVVNVLSTNASLPLEVSGFNAGIIVPYNATTAAPQASAFDIPNNWAFYQEGLNGNAQINGSGQGLQGLPTDRRLRSQADGSLFEFGPYGGANALMLGNGYPASGTLTLTSPQALNKLAILASSANGGGLGTVVLNFSDGTKSQNFNLNAQDWYNTTANVAVQGFGRVRLGQGTFTTENPGWNNPNIYQTTIDLAALGLNKIITSVSFTNPPVGGSRTTAILGLSGQAMPAAVAITKQPVSTTNNVPTNPVTFSVAAMGTPPLSYQWYRGNPGSGLLLGGSTSTNLTLTSVQLSHAGNYYVVVTNDFGATTSSVATLTVFRAPQIVQQPTPAALSLHTGESISLNVGATGALPLSYYWRTNGVIIPGATAAILNLPNLQPGNAGNYSVLVSNAFGAIASGVISLTVTPPNYPYAQLVLADNPMSYWRLNELSGNVAYDYVGGRNGTYNNTQLGQPGHSLVDTHPAARFGILSSQNSYVGGIPIDFGSAPNQSFTVEAWVRGSVPSTDAGLITKGTGSGGEQFNLDCGGPGRAFRFFVRKDDGTAVLATGNIPPNNQWQHVVGVMNRSAGFVALYVNGISNASATIESEAYRGVLRTTNAVSIGARQGGTTTYNNQFVGSMQDVAIYNHALSPARILAHYQAASNRAPVFASNPFAKPMAQSGQVYNSSVAGEAADPNGDAVTYAKVSGPAWLSVGSSGVISGVPANVNANTNTFVVSARDVAGLSNVATLNIYVNARPTFVANPFSLPDLAPGQTLAGNLATNVTDLNPGDVLTFAKVSGPDWVEVASDGTLSGTPLSGNEGTNSIVVSVTDPYALSENATMLVRVLALEPLVANITPQGQDLLLTWTGGTPPYQVEMNTNLTDPVWIPVGETTTENSLLLTPSNAATFYRIIGN
jgi:hypothetical protein